MAVAGPPFRPVPRPRVESAGPALDASQQAVVDHVRAAGCGPALVLAGPGTGKTTTLVEAVAARVEAGGDPQRILVLTFSRKAAAELRSRIAARLGGVAPGQLAWTFHAYAYALLGALPVEPGAPSGRLRLLSGPEQDVVVRELLAGDIAGDGVGALARRPARGAGHAGLRR